MAREKQNHIIQNIQITKSDPTQYITRYFKLLLHICTHNGKSLYNVTTSRNILHEIFKSVLFEEEEEEEEEKNKKKQKKKKKQRELTSAELAQTMVKVRVNQSAVTAYFIKVNSLFKNTEFKLAVSTVFVCLV